MTNKVELGKSYKARNGAIITITDLNSSSGIRPVLGKVTDTSKTIDLPGKFGDKSYIRLSEERHYNAYGFEHQPIGGETRQDMNYDLLEEVAETSAPLL